MEEKYEFARLHIPLKDLSGELGQRLLRLLSIQVCRNLKEIRRSEDTGENAQPGCFHPGNTYFKHFACGNAYAFAVMARFGKPGRTMGGSTRAAICNAAVELIRAVCRNHPCGGSLEEWNTFDAARHIHTLAMGAWLLGQRLDEETRELVARVIEHEADRFLGARAPAQLYDDTQAESNAWTGSGLAAAACILEKHPHSSLWDEKAREYMISAYAVANDVTSEKRVDRKPLREWLSGPNAFLDYSAENHGFVHPDYIAAISEMVRSAITYALAGEPVPEAVTFNAENVFDLLLTLLLPDGRHLYPQGTDYTPRRIDSFFQACNIVTLYPNPVRKAAFLRSMDSIEGMADRRPELPMSAWLGAPCELGTTWGLTQNYLMCRLFGTGGETIPDHELEPNLSCVHISTGGRFAIHRTGSALSCFSWHASTTPPRIMVMTIPLEKDVIPYPMPWSLVGQVVLAGDHPQGSLQNSLALKAHELTARADGFGLLLELEWCEGKVAQRCAFISLPDGSSVYLEYREAVENIEIVLCESGNVVIMDGVRLLYQEEPRRFYAQGGKLRPGKSAIHPEAWVNVDDRMGYVALGAEMFKLEKVAGRPCIYRGEGTMYDTCRLAFLAAGMAGARFHAGDSMGFFALISIPGCDSEKTMAIAESAGRAGWLIQDRNTLAFQLNDAVVFANFSGKDVVVERSPHAATLKARTASYLV